MLIGRPILRSPSISWKYALVAHRPERIAVAPLSNMRAKSLRLVGSASDLEESLASTAIRRAFTGAGIRLALFKSQNVLTSVAVCPDMVK
jgi:hypothetical protein